LCVFFQSDFLTDTCIVNTFLYSQLKFAEPVRPKSNAQIM